MRTTDSGARCCQGREAHIRCSGRVCALRCRLRLLPTGSDGCVFFRKACKEIGDSGDVTTSIRLSQHSTTFCPCIGVELVPAMHETRESS